MQFQGFHTSPWREHLTHSEAKQTISFKASMPGIVQMAATYTTDYWSDCKAPNDTQHSFTSILQLQNIHPLGLASLTRLRPKCPHFKHWTHYSHASSGSHTHTSSRLFLHHARKLDIPALNIAQLVRPVLSKATQVCLWAEAHPLFHRNGRGSNGLVQNGPSPNPMHKGNPSPSGVVFSLSLSSLP